MEKILSIIIPTYNMERYLTKCLSSLIVPDEELLKRMEVLVVNDGSKDNSSKIAHEFETKYPNTFRVIDKENGNYGSCINRGLKEATGKYIKILDADDSFQTSNLAAYMNLLNKTCIDLILTDYELVNAAGDKIETRSFSIPPNEILDIKTHIGSLYRIQMHAVTFRTDLLKEMEYVQLEGISYTDAEWVFRPLTQGTTFLYLKKVLYKYLVGRSGQTADLNVWAKKYNERERIARKQIGIYEKSKKQNMDERLLDYLAYRIDRTLHGIYLTHLLINRDREKAFALDGIIKEASPETFKRIEKLKIHDRVFPKEYIKLWHQKGELPPKWASFFYKKIKKLK